MCLLGSIQGEHIRLLIDSGSSHTFISSELASKLSGVSSIPFPLKVQVANGHTLLCNSCIFQAIWTISAYEFCSDLKVLDLSSFDTIVGMDWLTQFSPMNVHWGQKWMAIPYAGSTTMLFGDMEQLPEGSLLQIFSAQVQSAHDASDVVPAEVQQVMDKFASVFAVPIELPPQRACDHTIPLVNGASPVSLRPYRFAPALKDEIERQIRDMLASGIIQKSTSPFSSSVLLVKKKYNTWRFCVDYRHLNAITKKSKYPVPIIDEFLDELASASWFSSLDLRSGFHQIRLKPGEEFKTAFQTHCSHFEFRVLPFGLTGAPGTFQFGMNSTLAPYLRKFVLVFFDDILIYSRTRNIWFT